MDLSPIQPLLTWIQEHPGLAGAVVFAIAATESLAIVGILVPGIVFMLGIGALVGLEVLGLWETLLWAAAGAVVGDGVSYWLGRHFDSQLRSIWPFTKYPDLIPRGEKFFHKHGGKSILFGRFIGPIRPIIPAVAGIMHMNPYHFYFVNILSAVAWAPVVILPGVAFGTSLHLATEVGMRLVVVLIVMLAITWLLVVAMRRTATPLLLKVFGRWEEHWDFVVRNAFNSTVIVIVIVFLGGSYAVISSKEKSFLMRETVKQQQAWWRAEWQNLPAYRDIHDHRDPFSVQWWAEVEFIKTTLLDRGWQPASMLSLKNAITWLSPSPDIEKLPLWKKRYIGNKEALVLVKRLGSENRQMIMRVWPAFRVKAQNNSRLWLATVTLMELIEPYPKYFYPAISADSNDARRKLLQDLETMATNIELKLGKRNLSHDGWDGKVLLIKRK